MNPLTGNRMVESQRCAVKQKLSSSILFYTVNGITDNRMLDRLQMDTYLMGSPGKNPYLQQSCITKSEDRLIKCVGGLLSLIHI